MNDSDKENHVLRLSDIAKEPAQMLPPIHGYENTPLVTLEKAIEPLITVVPEIEYMLCIVKTKCENPPSELLWDESASIMLYSLGWPVAELSLYMKLNSVLRNESRDLLQPWFLYLKLLITALSKLPSKPLTVHRGVKSDLSADYWQGKTVVWWGFTSCTSSIHVLEESFLGKTGTRTLFSIDCHSGRDIRPHSVYKKENEILLPAACEFEVISKLNLGNDLHMIQLKEINPSRFLLASLLLDSAFFSSMRLQNNIHYKNDELEQMISKCQSRELNLSGKCFNEQDMHIIVTLGIIGKQCTTLDLSNSEVTKDSVSLLARALHNNTSLEELNFSHANISDSGTLLLASVTNSSILKRLNLEANDISDEGAKYLAEMFKTNTKLIQLSLSVNQITSNGVNMLANVLKDGCTYIQVLNLSANTNIDDECVSSVTTMIEHNQSLKKLDLRYCKFSKDGKATLRAMAKLKRGFDIWLSNNT